jgi:hypothetical protein
MNDLLIFRRFPFGTAFFDGKICSAFIVTKASPLNLNQLKIKRLAMMNRQKNN